MIGRWVFLVLVILVLILRPTTDKIIYVNLPIKNFFTPITIKQTGVKVPEPKDTIITLKNRSNLIEVYPGVYERK